MANPAQPSSGPLAVLPIGTAIVPFMPEALSLSLTLPELRAACDELNVSKVGNKAMLLARCLAPTHHQKKRPAMTGSTVVKKRSSLVLEGAFDEAAFRLTPDGGARCAPAEPDRVPQPVHGQLKYYSTLAHAWDTEQHGRLLHVSCPRRDADGLVYEAAYTIKLPAGRRLAAGSQIEFQLAENTKTFIAHPTFASTSTADARVNVAP